MSLIGFLSPMLPYGRNLEVAGGVCVSMILQPMPARTSMFLYSRTNLSRDSGCIMNFKIDTDVSIKSKMTFLLRNGGQCMYWCTHGLWHKFWTIPSHGRLKVDIFKGKNLNLNPLKVLFSNIHSYTLFKMNSFWLSNFKDVCKWISISTLTWC